MLHFKEFLIRPAKNEDIPAIKNVIYPILADYGLKPSENGKDSDLSDIEKTYFAHNGFFGVAVNVKTSEVVGTIGLYAVDTKTCELRKMYLRKNCRGNGLGKFMLYTILELAREKGFKRIYLETISPLQAAISMYKKAGFQETKPKEISDRVDQAFELIL